MKKTLKLAALALALTLPFSAFAHKAWLQPSQTVLAGNNPWVTVDAAVSNDLFYFNHVPLKTDNLAITAPDGSNVAAQNTATGKFHRVRRRAEADRHVPHRRGQQLRYRQLGR